MSNLSNWEKNYLARARNTQRWVQRNPWIRFVFIGVGLFLFFKAPLLGFFLFGALGLWFVILWNIIRKA